MTGTRQVKKNQSNISEYKCDGSIIAENTALYRLSTKIIDVMVRKTMTTNEFAAWLTADMLNNDFGFRKNAAGDLYAAGDVTGAATKFRTSYANANKAGYYDSASQTLQLTWDQMQYYIIKGKPDTSAIIPPAEAANENYSWHLTSFIFRNKSSSNNLYYPTIEIDLNGATDVEIINRSNNNKSFKFSNIPANVKKIVVDNENGVITADNGLNIYQCFNFGFLGLVRGDNKLSVKGKCVLRFICDFPVNVGG